MLTSALSPSDQPQLTQAKNSYEDLPENNTRPKIQGSEIHSQNRKRNIATSPEVYKQYNDSVLNSYEADLKSILKKSPRNAEEQIPKENPNQKHSSVYSEFVSEDMHYLSENYKEKDVKKKEVINTPRVGREIVTKIIYGSPVITRVEPVIIRETISQEIGKELELREIYTSRDTDYYINSSEVYDEREIVRKSVNKSPEVNRERVTKRLYGPVVITEKEPRCIRETRSPEIHRKPELVEVRKVKDLDRFNLCEVRKKSPLRGSVTRSPGKSSSVVKVTKGPPIITEKKSVARKEPELTEVRTRNELDKFNISEVPKKGEITKEIVTRSPGIRMEKTTKINNDPSIITQKKSVTIRETRSPEIRKEPILEQINTSHLKTVKSPYKNKDSQNSSSIAQNNKESLSYRAGSRERKENVVGTNKSITRLYDNKSTQDLYNQKHELTRQNEIHTKKIEDQKKNITHLESSLLQILQKKEQLITKQNFLSDKLYNLKDVSCNVTKEMQDDVLQQRDSIRTSNENKLLKTVKIYQEFENQSLYLKGEYESQFSIFNTEQIKVEKSNQEKESYLNILRKAVNDYEVEKKSQLKNKQLNPYLLENSDEQNLTKYFTGILTTQTAKKLGLIDHKKPPSKLDSKYFGLVTNEDLKNITKNIKKPIKKNHIYNKGLLENQIAAISNENQIMQLENKRKEFNLQELQMKYNDALQVELKKGKECKQMLSGLASKIPADKKINENESVEQEHLMNEAKKAKDNVNVQLDVHQDRNNQYDELKKKIQSENRDILMNEQKVLNKIENREDEILDKFENIVETAKNLHEKMKGLIDSTANNMEHTIDNIMTKELN